MAKKVLMTLSGAENLGLDALLFLAADETRLTRFLSLTGTDIAGLRKSADDPSMLAAVLEYLMQDESLLLVFTSSKDIEPDQVAPALAMLTRASIGPAHGH